MSEIWVAKSINRNIEVENPFPREVLMELEILPTNELEIRLVDVVNKYTLDCEVYNAHWMANTNRRRLVVENFKTQLVECGVV